MSRDLRVAASALAIPVLVVGGDLATRGPLVLHLGRSTYALGALTCVVMWILGLEVARDPRRVVRACAFVALGALGALGLGLQVIVRHLTHAYLGRRALILALGMPRLGHAEYVKEHVGLMLAALGAPALLAGGLAWLRTRWLGLRASGSQLTLVSFVLTLGFAAFAPLDSGGVQPLPPDVLLVHGLGGPLLFGLGLAQKPKSLPIGEHESLPPLLPYGRDRPPILLILGESVRRDSVCSEPSASCTKSPRLDAGAPHRIGYRRAFSVASCTELASSTLWTGMAITTTPKALARAPLVWDWAHALGYRTAYVTSQNLLFQQADQFLRGSRIDLEREARDDVFDAPIDGGSPDEHTTSTALAFIEADGPPAFVVVHHANTHVPYRQVAGYTPHPSDAWGSYQNSLLYNDSVIGDLLEKLRKGARGRRAIVVFTSDHGEAFEEHGVAYHSFDLYAEQVDVPLWIDAPDESLRNDMRTRLDLDAKVRPVSTYDVTATVIDLMGGFDQPELAGAAAALAGTSLMRAAPIDRDVFLWNCPPTRECVSDAIGLVSFPKKLHYVGREARYVCHDLESDPHEENALPADECSLLRSKLDATFGPRAVITRL